MLIVTVPHLLFFESLMEFIDLILDNAIGHEAIRRGYLTILGMLVDNLVI